MADYEQAAFNSLNKLNIEQERDDLKRKIVSDYPIVGKLVNKRIIDYKNREKALTQNQQYDAAERVKRKREALEEIDMENFIRQDIQKLVAKEEIKLNVKHDTALMKRIQRDRNEELLHRQIDSKRMIQRSKNFIQHIHKRHDMEMKKTKEFLHYSLGTRPQPKQLSIHNRSQSNKKRRMKKLRPIEGTQDQRQQKSFFITERAEN